MGSFSENKTFSKRWAMVINIFQSRVTLLKGNTGGSGPPIQGALEGGQSKVRFKCGDRS